MQRALFWIPLLLWLLVAGGCGYRLAGGEGDRLPEGVRVLYIPLFENRTKEPFLENLVSEAVIRRSSRALGARVAEDPKGAEAILSGTISSYSNHVTAYAGDDKITEYRSAIGCQAQLRSTVDNRVLWKGSASWRQEYRASLDRGQEESGETLAQEEISQRLADELFARVTENF